MKTNKRSQSKSIPIADASPISESYHDKPTPEEVAQRAYENYESDGSQHGNDVEHWLAAEAGLLTDRNL